MKNVLTILCAFSTCLSACATHPTDALAEVMRTTAAKYKTSYVDLAVVMSFTAEGASHNREVEVPGVIMDASGLIVTASFAIDPDAGPAEMHAKVVSLRIRPSGGAEVDGKIVLRDSDRGLAFIRPVQPLANITPIDFVQSADVQLGDTIFTLGSLGRTANRGQRVSTERIVGMVEKPQKVAILAPAIASPFGNAVFNEKGEIVGLVTLKMSKNAADSNSFNPFDMGLVTIVGGKDIVETASQAPQLKDLKESAPKAPTTKG